MEASENNTTWKPVRIHSSFIHVNPFLDKDHRIWIKWTVAFSDKIRWSAEKQGY